MRRHPIDCTLLLTPHDAPTGYGTPFHLGRGLTSVYGVAPFVGGLSLLVQLASSCWFLVYITSERRFDASNIRWLDLRIDWPV